MELFSFSLSHLYTLDLSILSSTVDIVDPDVVDGEKVEQTIDKDSGCLTALS